MPVFNYLAGNGYISGCEQCGRPDLPVDCYEVNGYAHTLCEGCRQEVAAVSSL